ncbi:hypothetical protein ABZ642_15320 [Streptomyces sp. NPDC007157]|uniref:hypothetical protein n=1 Tax=Streptomyces sp. NPDC007157 TaxID=3154681 RepID=UPI0033EAEE04
MKTVWTRPATRQYPVHRQQFTWLSPRHALHRDPRRRARSRRPFSPAAHLTTGLASDGLQATGSTADDPSRKDTATNGTTPTVGYQSGTGSFSYRDTWQPDALSQQADRYT